MTLTLGPLALPVAPVLLLGFLVLTSIVGRAISPREIRPRVDNAIWCAALLGLIVARLSHVLVHFEAYRGHPLSWLDIRDGGFIALPGALAGLALLAAWWRRLGSLRWRLLACALGATLLWGWVSSGLASRSPSPSRTLDDIPVMLSSLDDPAQTLALLQIAQRDGARPVVVNLWATWCPPCRAEMPVFARLQQERRDVRFVFVNQGEPREIIKTYLQREGLVLEEMWLDPSSSLGNAVGSSGLPTTLLFDAQGRLIKTHLGVLNEAALRVMLAGAGRRP